MWLGQIFQTRLRMSIILVIKYAEQKSQTILWASTFAVPPCCHILQRNVLFVLLIIAVNFHVLHGVLYVVFNDFVIMFLWHHCIVCNPRGTSLVLAWRPRSKAWFHTGHHLFVEVAEDKSYDASLENIHTWYLICKTLITGRRI